jgi:hypothetical protein
MLFLSRLALIVIFVFLFSGCGALKSARLSSEQNENQHIQSCGPEAIYETIQSLKNQGYDVEEISKKEISRELRGSNQCSTITRDALSLFIYETKSITFPCEIMDFFIKRGFKIEIIKNISDLKKDDTALILISQGRTLNYHWMSYPRDNNIMKFFGKDTVLKRIYLLIK